MIEEFRSEIAHDNFFLVETNSNKPRFNPPPGGFNFNKDWLNFHGTPLTVSWMLLIDIAVIVAAVRWQRHTFIVHTLIGLIVIGLTLGAAIPALKNNTFLQSQRTPTIQKIHNVVGFIVTVWLGVQIVTGILSRVMQYSAEVHSNVVKAFKVIHQVSGYLLMVISKFNYLNIKWKDEKLQASFVLLLVAEIPFLIILLLIKFGYWTLSQETVESQIKLSEKQKEALLNENISNGDVNPNGKQIKIKEKPYEPHGTNYFNQKKTNDFELQATDRPINNQYNAFMASQRQKEYHQNQKLKAPLVKAREPQVQYFSQVSIPLQKYVLFNDFVYDITGFEGRHPGGEKLIALMNKREINRFMYGSYSAELTPTVKLWNHTKDAMRLVGPPVGQVLRSSPMKGLEEYNKVKVDFKMIISPEPNHPTFLIHLKKQPSNRLQWRGFTQMSQIGQYFSLTLSDKKGHNRVTRLYTTIWCMRPQNIDFIQKNFLSFKNSANQSAKLHAVDLQSNNTLHSEKNSSEIVPLVIKRYEKGDLTQKLLNSEGFDGQMILSKSMGSGMKYGDIKEEGKVIIVCGGTGLLPFCDFIDLLFKRVVFLEGKQAGVEFARKDPLVKEDLIKKRSFKLYCAAESINDLLPLTLFQVEYLSKLFTLNFQATFRLRSGLQEFRQKYPSIVTQKDFFNTKIESDLNEGVISQIYVCGPPSMNASIGQLLQGNEQTKGLYHFM